MKSTDQIGAMGTLRITQPFGAAGSSKGVSKLGLAVLTLTETLIDALGYARSVNDPGPARNVTKYFR